MGHNMSKPMPLKELPIAAQDLFQFRSLKEGRMKTVTVVAFLPCLCLAAAWPLKPDDKKLRIREANRIASRDQGIFVKAVAENDEETLAELTRDIIDVVREAQENNEKLVAKLAPLLKVLKQLTSESTLPLPLARVLQFLKLRALNLLTHVLDDNRDNVSYYRLDAVRDWIERRTRDDGAKDVIEFKDAHRTVVEARDALETMASTLVAGLKEMKDESSIFGNRDAEKIRAVAEKIVKTVEDNVDVLIDKTQNTWDTLEVAVKRWSHE